MQLWWRAIVIAKLAIAVMRLAIAVVKLASVLARLATAVVPPRRERRTKERKSTQRH